jgi:hypothetical protein
VKRIAIAVTCFLTLLNIFPAMSSADIFDTEYGLHKAVVIIRDGDAGSYAKAMDMAEKAGARGMVGLPPTMIFGRFPAGTGEVDFAGLDVRFFTEAADIDPMEVDLVTLKVARGLLDQERLLRMSKPIPIEPFDDIVFDFPAELAERNPPKAGDPKGSAPAEVAERSIRQNSEFLIGNVLINVILPESSGSNQSEDWTEDEIGNVLRDVALGLSQYENATHWVKPDLVMQINCPAAHRGVSVSIEPIEGDWDYDPYWISEAMTYLGESYDIDMPVDAWPAEKVHIFNNAMRESIVDANGNFLFDWVFTAFIADASVNGCWQGPAGGYAAYTIFLGGPYIVVPYPACGFGDGINFAHVFIHEMSHIFWALDEYASAAQGCKERSGYLNYINANSYFQGCGVGQSCIMNNYLLTEPLPICQWTMGQVGLADEYDIFTGYSIPNSIPDLYEVRPQLELNVPGTDTLYTSDLLIEIRIRTTPVPNKNPFFVGSGIDYAPEIAKFEMTINKDGFFEPVPGNWTGRANFFAGLILREGLDPGENWLFFRAENVVGLSTMDSIMVYFVGIRYYAMSAMADGESIEVRWQTASELFGADFEIYREDLTARTAEELLAAVDGDSPYEEIEDRCRFRYLDDTVLPGHTFRYRVIGTINAVVNNVPMTLTYESRELTETAVVPLAGNFVSHTIPNPTDDRGSTFSIDVPKSYYDPSGTTSRDIMRAPMAETKTDVAVMVYDVTGRKVREVYNLGVFGGQILTMTWDGLDENGKQVAAGVYFMKVTAGPNEQVQKVVIIR